MSENNLTREQEPVIGHIPTDYSHVGEKPELEKAPEKSPLKIWQKPVAYYKSLSQTGKARLNTAAWFFIWGAIFTLVFGVDPGMGLWYVTGYTLLSGLVFSAIGSLLVYKVLIDEEPFIKLGKSIILGLMCALIFIVICILATSAYLLLTHAVALPRNKSEWGTLGLFGALIPFAFVYLPSVICSVFSVITLKLTQILWREKKELILSKLHLKKPQD